MNELKDIRFIMYCRKSTDAEDRQIQSIEDQEKELNREVKQRGLKVVKMFSEARSAKEPGRPQFNEMIQMIKNGEADGILCWKPNRLARNPVDGGEIQWLLQQGVIKSLLTPGREYRPSDNVIMLAVEFGMANQYSIDLAKDVKRGMRAKAEKGWRPHQATIGYLNDKHGEQGNKRIFVDPERFPLVRKMWDLLLTGAYTVPRIVEIANKEWGLRTKRGEKLAVSVAYKIFNNPFYYGEYLYDGDIHQGKHKAMITREEFDRAQKILGRAGRPRPHDKRLPFTGIVRCAECGSMITCEEKLKRLKSTGELKSYVYLRCGKKKGVCSQKPIRYEDLAEQVETYLKSIEIPPEFLQWALEVLRNHNEIEETDRNQILANHQRDYQSVVKSIDNLINLYVSPENANKDLLSTDEYKVQKNNLVQAREEAQTEIRRVESRMDEWLDLTEKTFEFACYARTAYAKGDFETKTRLLRALGQNFTFKAGILRVELKQPYAVIREGLQTHSVENNWLELVKVAQNKPKTAQQRAIANKVSVWSG